MKELGITVNKILKDWLQPKGEGNIVFTDDIAINEVTDEIVAECQGKYSELLQQRDELKEALISLMWQFAYYGTKNNVAVMHTGGLSALEDAFSALGLSDPITVENFEAAIKNTEKK
jgi:hypothetical protein